MAEPFKNFIDASAARRLAEGIVAVDPRFPAAQFVSEATDGLEERELKDRVRHYAGVLATHLSQDIRANYQTLAASLGTPPSELDIDGGFYLWPMLQYVEDTGTHHPEAALDALHAMTQHWSGEFAIRPLLRDHPEPTLERLHTWVTDPSVHVRRLVSEGTRPLLPWGPRLTQFQTDPEPVLALLERLRTDPERYVQRSVANNLNDIAKDHPQTVVALGQRWYQDASKDVRWIVRHALRSLLKKGDTGALAVLGFAPPRLTLEGPQLSTPSVRIGESLTFSVQLMSTTTKAQALMVDYAVHFMKKNGKTSPKVFKWTTFTLPGGGSRTIERRQSLREVSTRVLYPGRHSVEVLVNGEALGGADFDLLR